MNQKIFVIDNFIESPLAYYDKIIKPELKLKIEEKYPESKIFQNISSILKSNIRVLECKEHIQKENDGSPICCHQGSDYIGVLYLSLPLVAWGEVGIKFYSHKETGLDSFPTQEQARNITDIDKTFSQNLENWKEYGSIPIKHNRMILFRSNLWHSYGNGFGSDLNTSMLYKKIIIKNG